MFFYLSQRLYQNNVMRYNCSRLFVAFGKTFVAFDCDEKLTQNVAQITMWHHVPKDFFCLHFVYDHVLLLYFLSPVSVVAASGFN